MSLNRPTVWSDKYNNIIFLGTKGPFQRITLNFIIKVVRVESNQPDDKVKFTRAFIFVKVWRNGLVGNGIALIHFLSFFGLTVIVAFAFKILSFMHIMEAGYCYVTVFMFLTACS